MLMFYKELTCVSSLMDEIAAGSFKGFKRKELNRARLRTSSGVG